MKEGLIKKLGSLSLKSNKNYLYRLCCVLSDRYESFIYGGISDKEYSNPPKEKLERAEEILYAEMFENKPLPLFT